MRKKTQPDVEDGFLERWSVKKSQARQPLAQQNDAGENEETDRQPNPSGPESADQPSGDSAEDQAVLTDEDMPDIELLDEKSDFSGFLSPGVSDELRKIALRKLFRSKIFNVRDGLDDYDDDFRSFTALGDLITSDMKHQIELAEERKREMEQRDQQQPAAQDEPAGSDESGKVDEQLGGDRDAQPDVGDDQSVNKQADIERSNSDDSLATTDVDEDKCESGIAARR